MARLVLSKRAKKERTSQCTTRKAGEVMSPHFLGKCLLAGLSALVQASVVVAQSSSPDQTLSANDLARAVVANELNAQDGNHSRWIYRVDREEQGKKKAKEVVQTSQGLLDRVVAIDGHPLSAKEQQEERIRIENLVRNPAAQQKLEQTQRKDAEQCKAFFKMIPDALTFSSGRRPNKAEVSA